MEDDKMEIIKMSAAKKDEKIKRWLIELLSLFAPPFLLYVLLQPETFWEKLAWFSATMAVYIYYKLI